LISRKTTTFLTHFLAENRNLEKKIKKLYLDIMLSSGYAKSPWVDQGLFLLCG
jgi:hypothetical protein